MINTDDATFNNLMEHAFNNINAVGALAGMDDTKEFAALRKSFNELGAYILELEGVK